MKKIKSLSLPLNSTLAMNGKILIVEDDATFGIMLRKWFERNGYAPVWKQDLHTAREELAKQEYRLVLCDLRLPDGDGIELLAWLNEQRQEIPVIIMTGYGEVQTAVSAIKMGAFDFLEKPVNPSLLAKKIETALRLAAEKKPIPPGKTERIPKPEAATPPAVTTIRGKSPLAARMYSYIERVAPTQMAVMIIGESGTGKEHAARMIHACSTRARAPFVAVDCGSLSRELAPSELFGHKKGAFTSAVEDKTGFFAEANGGTLFLDEVGNLPYGVQVQMLRALQERKIRPVGSASDREVDVRIVAATNENLEKAIAEGRFREDLYHRLNEFVIRVPALRECPQDIPLYAAHFIDEADRELGKQVKSIPPQTLQTLQNYAWPGNLRELRNVIRRSVLFANGDTLAPELLPPLTDRHEETPDRQTPLALSREEEKERILNALRQTHGNKSKAALLLGIDRKTLYNKMHAYGLEL